MDSSQTIPAGNSLLQRLMNSDIPKTRFFQLLTSPWNPPPELTSGITSQASEDAMTMEPQTFTVRPDPETSPLMLPLHKPTGAWKWATGLGIRACTNVVHLDSDKKNSMYYGTGTIGKQDIQFICRTWPLRDDFPEFTSELGLFKSQLKPLLGTYVPNIIGVYTGVGIANVLMELPHPAFWIEASADMPDALKKRCVEAYQKLHDAGVLHAAPHPRNILIGGDARVTIVNFGQARVLDPIVKVNQRQATLAELRLEMRKVKFQLDYDNAREKEKRKWADSKQRSAWNREERQRSIRQPDYILQLQDDPDEDKLDPPVEPRKVKGWVDWKYESKRFIVPTISSEAFAHAADKFIANIRRMEREGDGPPPSRSPTPPPPSIQPVQNSQLQPVIVQDEDSDLPDTDKPPAPRHSLRKRKEPETASQTDTPLSKRQKTTVDTPTTATPPAKSITVDSFFIPMSLRNPSSLAPTDGPPSSRTSPAVRVRDFAYENAPGPSHLRSALKPLPKTLKIFSDGDVTLSETARGKRKRIDDEDDLGPDSTDETPSKRIRTDVQDPFLSQVDEKHVSFSPAPDVFLKKYTIPPHLFTKPKKKGFRFRRGRKSRILSTYDDGDGDDSDIDMEQNDKHREILCSKYNFTFTSRPFQFVSRWIADIFHATHW